MMENGVLSLVNLSVTTVLCVFILISCIKYIMDLFRKNPRHVKFLKTLPGPPVLPFVSNLFEFMHNADGTMQILFKYEEKYGTIYRLWFGKHLVIGTTDLNFTQSSNVLDKQPLMDTAIQFWHDTNIFIAPTPLWKKNRKELQICFARNSLSKKMPSINGLVRKYVNKIEEHVNGPQFTVSDIMDVWTY